MIRSYPTRREDDTQLSSTKVYLGDYRPTLIAEMICDVEKLSSNMLTGHDDRSTSTPILGRNRRWKPRIVPIRYAKRK